MMKSSAIYSMNRNEIEDISIDRSLVEIRNEKLIITILNIIANGFVNNLVFVAHGPGQWKMLSYLKIQFLCSYP